MALPSPVGLVRLELVPYRLDRATVGQVTSALEGLRELLATTSRADRAGGANLALEAQLLMAGDVPRAALSMLVAPTLAPGALAALRGAYPNLRARRWSGPPPDPAWPAISLAKRRHFLEPLALLDPGPYESALADRLLTALAASGVPAHVQIALAPCSAARVASARRAHRERERTARRRAGAPARPAQVEEAELREGLELRHRGLLAADIRVTAPTLAAARHAAAALRVAGSGNRLRARRVRAPRAVRARRLAGARLPIARRSRRVYATSELAALWQLPSPAFAAVPLLRGHVPVAAAPAGIARPAAGPGLLRDAHGPVTIELDLRRQNTAVTGTVEQGKTSYLVASVAEDLLRERCAVVVIDPKGDAADAALSLVDVARPCTLLDLAAPTVGFDPLAADAPADAVADGVIAALRSLFSEGDIRASSDRYLRNAILAVLAHEPRPTLWDAARLLSPSPDGEAYRAHVAASLLGRPELQEVVEFFAAELPVALVQARATTTAKLDAPANKLARLLNSPAIKRVLLNRSHTVDFARVLARAEVVVVRGAMGEMGTENTAVVMQLLLASLDAALARQQDRVPAGARTAVALKVDEAPLCLNRSFARTMALKRSAGLETVACWQTDAQWEDPVLREQLDALFAHRVMFATASSADAHASAALLAHDPEAPLPARTAPDLRLHLPRHWAAVSWTTRAGRQAPFVARTHPARVDPQRLRALAAAQTARGARPLVDLGREPWAPEEPTSAPRVLPMGEGEEEGEGIAVSPPGSWWQELAVVAAAPVVRVVGTPASPSRRAPRPRERGVLELLAALGCVLSSHVHARCGATLSVSSTQRLLKSMWEAALVGRVAIRGTDGRAAPMAYVLGAAGRQALGLPPVPEPDPDWCRAAVRRSAWVLLLADRLGPSSAIARVRDGTVHVTRERERMEVVWHPAPGSGRLAALLERHERTVEEDGAAVLALVAPDAPGARRLADAADPLLQRARVHPGRRPERWPRPARERTLFFDESDLHRDCGRALRVAPRPPALRAPGEPALQTVALARG